VLDGEIEPWFKEKHQCTDHLISSWLKHMRLATCVDNVYIAVNLVHAKAILDERWDSLFQYN
jgi:hypothetical protein